MRPRLIGVKFAFHFLKKTTRFCLQLKPGLPVMGNNVLLTCRERCQSLSTQSLAQGPLLRSGAVGSSLLHLFKSSPKAVDVRSTGTKKGFDPVAFSSFLLQEQADLAPSPFLTL